MIFFVMEGKNDLAYLFQVLKHISSAEEAYISKAISCIFAKLDAFQL